MTKAEWRQRMVDRQIPDYLKLFDAFCDVPAYADDTSERMFAFCREHRIAGEAVSKIWAVISQMQREVGFRDPRIEVGSWVNTRFGKAVCVAISDREGEERLIQYRYRATRQSDGKEIWPMNGDSTHVKPRVTFMAPATTFTKRICKLQGLYGEGES